MGICGPAGFPMKYTVLKDVDKVLMDHFVRCTVRVRVLQFGFEDLGISFREFSPAKIALVSVSINILFLSDMALCMQHPSYTSNPNSPHWQPREESSSWREVRTPFSAQDPPNRKSPLPDTSSLWPPQPIC